MELFHLNKYGYIYVYTYMNMMHLKTPLIFHVTRKVPHSQSLAFTCTKVYFLDKMLLPLVNIYIAHLKQLRLTK